MSGRAHVTAPNTPISTPTPTSGRHREPLPGNWQPWHDRLRDLRSTVLEHGAGALDGNTLNLAEFERMGPRIVDAGLVSQSDVDFVVHGMKHGFNLGVDEC